MYTTVAMNQYIHREAEQRLRAWLKLKKVLLLLGARQVGKTTLLKTFFKTYKTTYLNLDTEVDKQSFFRATPLDPNSAMVALGSPEILIIDEAQRFPQVSRIVKSWFDAEVTTKVILSGSSSLDILDHSAESLTGRNIKLYLPPLVFSEIVSAQSWYNFKLGKKSLVGFSEQLNSLLLINLAFGNYPEAVTTEDKPLYLNNLVSDYLLKDILQSSLIKTPELIRRLLLLLAHQTGSIVSVNELANSLNISRVTVTRYLDLLERTFVIFRLPSFSTNPRKEIAKNQKIFFWDTGVRNTLVGELNASPLRSDIGKIWENWVIAEFAKKNLLEGNLGRLYFWRSRIGSEVDLLVKNIVSGKIKAYEIKWSPAKARVKAFTNMYRIPVDVINRENFTSFLI
ncbi:MAG: hypothetical protein US31_C0005G0030 [Berkelbacteria bacterium GW2011_GWA1_36_9]|uniref:AAA ATPase n=1 Tax=Berkelbacteria bacterium GW2011_GWA1_36_9 TaxID=1618331 RepID=A0A0G0FX10_9BACT|nr:MAG: hypothetical protein US31_C0005G0030 [Berkelbacteria bacterium GW2011_GWA1_36_9]